MLQWAEKRRFEIAGLLSSILRDHLQAYDPIFSLTLRYLIRYFSILFKTIWPGQVDLVIHVATGSRIKIFGNAVQVVLIISI